MKTISIETSNTMTRIIISHARLQSRRLSKNPDEPELKKHYEEEQTEIRADIEKELREEHGDALSEEEIREYIADQMQPMDSTEEDIYYGRSGISFIDMSLHDVTNVEIHVSRIETEKHETRTQIRLMLLGGPYGPLCILEDSVNNMTDQNVLREGIGHILNTIAAVLPYETSLSARMKSALDRMDADLMICSLMDTSTLEKATTQEPREASSSSCV